MGYKLKNPVSAQSLANALGLEFFGADRMIESVSAYHQATAQDLTFARSISQPFADSITITGDAEGSECLTSESAALSSQNPRLDFIRALDYLETTVGFLRSNVESKVHPTAILGENVVIENGCEIAAGVVLGHNVVVKTGSVIGENSNIRPGAVIGGEGFGFSRLEDGTPLRFIHLGGVRIGKNVEIGENTSICRGTLSDTIIEDNVKIDNLVHLAHNCHVKDGAFIIACAEVSGGVTIGENAWIGPKVCILEKVTIGAGALIGIGSVVLSDVPEKTVFVGNPAKFLKAIE